MFRKLFLCSVFSAAVLLAGCQPDPTTINSTSQPRDGKTPMSASSANHSESNRDAMNTNSMNSPEANRTAMNNSAANADSMNRSDKPSAQNTANHSTSNPSTK